jgi:hypothetical protein
MNESYPNRRRFPRLSLKNPLLVKKVGEASEESLGKTRTVSLGGCLFHNDQALGVNSLLELLISLRGHVIQAKARVVYEIPASEGGVDVGVEFLGVSEGDQDLLAGILGVSTEEPGD